MLTNVILLVGRGAFFSLLGERGRPTVGAGTKGRRVSFVKLLKRASRRAGISYSKAQADLRIVCPDVDYLLDEAVVEVMVRTCEAEEALNLGTRFIGLVLRPLWGEISNQSFRNCHSAQTHKCL